MAKFIVRVQLDGNPPREDYDELHGLMDLSDYQRTIPSSKGPAILPHAEYFKESYELTCPDIRDEVKDIVRAVHPGKRFQLLCCEIKTWSAWGLKYE